MWLKYRVGDIVNLPTTLLSFLSAIWLMNELRTFRVLNRFHINSTTGSITTILDVWIHTFVSQIVLLSSASKQEKQERNYAFPKSSERDYSNVLLELKAVLDLRKYPFSCPSFKGNQKTIQNFKNQGSIPFQRIKKKVSACSLMALMGFTYSQDSDAHSSKYSWT